MVERADTRPGLVFNRATARKYELEKRHEQSSKPCSKHELETKRRDESLKTSALREDNKGFSLMLKMGYKKGEALGKTTSEEGGDEPEVKKRLIEPIPIVLKSDRVGLGRASESRQRVDEIRRAREHFEQQTRASYLDKKRSNFHLRHAVHSLHKCQRVCFHLDTSRNVS